MSRDFESKVVCSKRAPAMNPRPRLHRSGPDAGLPEQTTRQCTTEVTVEQGQTIVIGGLRQQEMGRSTTKVPLLGDIPLLGVLFKKEETVVRHSVLTILITPRVLTADNLIPEWPQVNIGDHDLVPKTDETSRNKKK